MCASACDLKKIKKIASGGVKPQISGIKGQLFFFSRNLIFASHSRRKKTSNSGTENERALPSDGPPPPPPLPLLSPPPPPQCKAAGTVRLVPTSVISEI